MRHFHEQNYDMYLSRHSGIVILSQHKDDVATTQH